MQRQEFRERDALIRSQDDSSCQIAIVDLPHEFAAMAAGRKNMERSRSGVTPYRDDPLDAIFSRGDHGSDGASFGAKPPARGIDAYALKHFARR